jgi:SAM-dependent methyltransferase
MRPCPNCSSHDARVRFVEEPFRVLRCRLCGLTYLGNPPPEDALYEGYYDASTMQAADYRAASPDPRLRELFAINQQRAERVAKLADGGRLLDVGCGRGQFVWSAAAAGFDAQGIDVSERAVAWARDELGVQAQARTLEEVAAEGEQFDVITLWHVLEHFADPYAALRLVWQALKPGGWCVVEVPNLYSLKFVLSRTKWEGGNHPLYHRTFFSAQTLRLGFDRAGFERVQRMRWSYRVPGRSGLFEQSKRVLDAAGLDAFLDVVGQKPGAQ